jgi:hypothetical protein
MIVPLVNGFSRTCFFYHNSYETTVESKSVTGFVRAATHTLPFPRQLTVPFLWATTVHQPVVTTGIRFQVMQKLGSVDNQSVINCVVISLFIWSQ